MKAKFFLLFAIAAMAGNLHAFTSVELPHVIVFHEGEDERTLAEIDEMLGCTMAAAESYLEEGFGKRTLYIYKDQREFQRQKHPVASLFLRLDWYIGDNIGERALIVSPNASVKVHSYRSIINAIPHEVIHTIVYSINKKCPLWISEGLALYLSNRHQGSRGQAKLPPAGIFTNGNPLYFEKHNGYLFADTFIEFVEKRYGKGKVIELIRTGDYEGTLGKNIADLYSEWGEYLKG